MSSIGVTPPNPLKYDPLLYQAASNDPLHPNDPHYPQYGSAPFFDDGVPAPTTSLGSLNEPTGNPSKVVFAAAHATVPISTDVITLTSKPHEGAGTELAVTQTYGSGIYNPGGAWVSASTGLTLTPGTLNSPNATHASSLSNNAATTLTGATGASNVSGGGTTTLTVTGTGFTRASIVTINGANQITNYASPTSLTVTNAQKKPTAGTLPVTVVTNGAATAPVNWTLT
jgi:hypothetical protein